MEKVRPELLCKSRKRSRWLDYASDTEDVGKCRAGFEGLSVGHSSKNKQSITWGEGLMSK